MPFINWTLMILVVLLILGFRNSSNLAAAYGIAVTGTMFITAVMLAVLELRVWKWPLWLVGDGNRHLPRPSTGSISHRT